MKIIKICDYSQEEIVRQACEVLRGGGVVVYPTETCYGLGADVDNQDGVDKLLAYKRRREGKPLSVLVSNVKEAEKYVELNDSARKFYDRFLPGPVTVVSYVRSRNNMLANGVASELDTLGMRISSHPLAMALADIYDHGITATSANPSWKKKPYSVDDLLSNLSEKQKTLIDLVIDAGELPNRESSTVVDTTLVGNMVMRSGDVRLESAEEFVSVSENDTRDLAGRLMLKNWNAMREKGLIFLLSGDLGMGKTVFAKGIGKFLQIDEQIVSPSYTLINEYEWKKNNVEGFFYHLDPWRVENAEDLDKLGLADMMKENNVVLIEWANKFEDKLREIYESLNTSIHVVKVVFDENEKKERIIRFE